jgi:uncharacterized protein YraI
MRVSMSVLVTMVVLALGMDLAAAREAETTAELGMRAGPGAQYELFLTMPSGAILNVGSCSRGWCRATWNSYSGYEGSVGVVREAAVPVIPVYPVYPYRSGHYPTADSYYALPPYADISPSFYRWRHLMMLQERNRYRYQPHVFHGYNGY